MKKKIALMLCALMLLSALLSGCGTDPTTADYNGYTYDELQQELETDLYMVYSVAVFLETYGFTVDDLSAHENAEVYDMLIANEVTDYEIAAAASWADVSGKFGTFTAVDEGSFTVDKAGNTLTTDLTLVFTGTDGSARNVTFEVVYDYYSMEVSGISINPEYSMKEKLATAGINTLISMAVVFMVLILISLIIYAFNIIPYLEKRKKEKAAAELTFQTEEKPIFVSEEEPADAADDTELIAVIAAAIAASEGTSTNEFVVRSINRR